MNSLAGARPKPPLLLPMVLGLASVACVPRAVHISEYHPQTSVDYQSIAAPASARYQLLPGESAKQPVLIERPAPDYPSAMIPLHLADVMVHARIVVDADGKVTAVRIVRAAGPTHPEAFDDSVRATARLWRYSPLQFLRWRDEYDAQGNLVDSRQVAVESKPFSLDYEFHFALRGGTPVVSSESAGNSH